MSDEVETVEQPDEGSVSGRRLSRRTMIAGTAGTAAAMWAAPAVTSLGPRAFAQSPVSCQGVPLPPDCTNVTLCGFAGATACVCGADLAGRYDCWALLVTVQGCSSDVNCPAPIPGVLPPSHCLDFCGFNQCQVTCADAKAFLSGVAAPTASNLIPVSLPK